MCTWPPAAQAHGEGLTKEERSGRRQGWPRSGLGESPSATAALGRSCVCIPETDGRLVWLEPAKGETTEGRGSRAQGMRERHVESFTGLESDRDGLGALERWPRAATPTAALFVGDRGGSTPNAQKPMNEKRARPVGAMGTSRCKKEGHPDRSCDTDTLGGVVPRERSRSEKGPAYAGSLGRGTCVPREPQTRRRDAERRRPLNERLKR